MLYQHSTGPTIRATLGSYFLLASVSSVLILGVAGEIEPAHLSATAMLVPFVLLGFAVSGPIRHRFDRRDVLSYGALGVTVASALLLLARALFG